MPLSANQRLAVDADGLFALRCALAAQRASSAALSADGPIGRRAVPRQAGLPLPGPVPRVRSAAPAGLDAAPAGPPEMATTPDGDAPPPGGPRIPTPARPVEPSDEQRTVMAIVTRAQGGDPEAFGELYDRYSQVVYRYICYRCGSPTLAEDLTSETFLRALRRITSYTWQGRDFGAWLVTIARNLLADHYKSGRYRMEIATSDLVEAGADRAQDGPEDDVLTSLTNTALIDAIKQLGAEQQECIVLRFLQGMSVSETALALGKNEGAIKALQYRAVKALGRLLPPELVA
jgi:RNA polymerase sigma-70 factor (ECF subfamily)